ncbi:MAG: COQ9 family protein [Rhodospirillaceae bacterium]
MLSAPLERTEARDRLLVAALPHVTFDGWTDAAFRAGARDLGLDIREVHLLFPGGAREAVAHFSDWADRRMLIALGGHDLAALRLRQRVALAVRLRLKVLARWREAVRRSVGFLALPPNGAIAARCLYRTVDAIWHAAGDRSADFSFYTKRALLAAVVSTTTLYWLDDDSEGSAESWGFLERRIDNVMRIPSLRQRLDRVAERLPDPFRILRAARDRGRG